MAAPSHASTVTLGLNYYETGTSAGVITEATASNLLAVPGSYNYGNPDTASVGGLSTIGSTGFGFYDDFVFTIAGASADSVTSTVSLPTPTGTQQISNLSERLYTASPSYGAGGVWGGTSTPLQLGAVAGEIDASTLYSGNGTTVVQIAPTMLAPGTYVLEIRGVTSSEGGSYSGNLVLSPAVPLPSALPLLVSGLGGLALLFRRRRAAQL